MAKNIVRFTKEDRSTFPYWFAHWCAFQMTALNLGCWKFKYLFHDIEKPWLKLFWPYKKLQTWHGEHNKHHLVHVINGGKGDWEAMIVDWECSRFTKQAAQLNAADEYDRIFNELEKFITTYRKKDNKTINYIIEHNIPINQLAYRIDNAYVNLHIRMNKLGIEHKYNPNYLDDYFNHKC